MTYRENWEQKNPNTDFDNTGIASKHCPRDLNSEVIDCPNQKVPRNLAITCDMCWKREIPEKAASEGLIEGFNDTNPEIVQAVKNMVSTIKDSGDRTQFETGAVRDMREGKGRCDLMPLEVVAEYFRTFYSRVNGAGVIFNNICSFMDTNDTEFLLLALRNFEHSKAFTDISTMFLEVAKHFEEGAKKYGENNWQKGIPVHCYIDSAIRHYLKWLRGDKDEPHDRAFVWNIMCCIWEVDYHKKEE